MRSRALQGFCISLVVVLLGAVAGAELAQARILHPSTWHLPWRKPPPAPPLMVNELPVATLDGTAAPAVPQYWIRNTLRIDLTAVAGAGTLQLKPSSVNGWPLRIEFNVRPGSMQQLEVTGDTRVLFDVPASGEALQLPLGSGAYTPVTKQLILRWE